MSADHDTQFVRTFGGVLGILFVFTFIIIIVANVIMAFAYDDERSPRELARVEEHVQPVYQVVTDPDALRQVAMTDDDAGGGGEPQSGDAIYNNVCGACHNSGVAGAPKVDNKQEWSSRLSEQGKDTLYERAINGYKGMPAKGGDPSLSDDEVKKAVDHILSTAGV